MPGNEIADKVHNFFDQENLSQGQHQSHVTGGNWAVPNSNLWDQRLIGTPLNSNSKNYSVQQSDSGNGNGRQSSRVPLGMEFTQLAPRAEFANGQSRNQQLNLNGFMHGHQGFQTRQHQAEFLGGGGRSLSGIEPQQGKGPEQSPGLTKNSERLETAEAPNNIDFLGAQQLLMRGQQSGLPQPRPRHQSGFNNISPWQQQIMIKQMQELRRQQQLQQLDQARQRNPNLINQLTNVAKQTTNDQLPALLNGTPVHDASKFFWPNEHIGGDSKVVPSSSQMFMVGGMNWVQQGGSPSMQGFPNGVMLSNEQGQALRSMGFVTQQLDQSLYGAPVSGMRENLNQHSNIQGFSHDSADMLTKAGASLNNSLQGDHLAAFQDQVCSQDGASVSKQGLQGKSMFGNVPVEGLSGGLLSGNIQQLDSVPRNAHMQGFPGRQEQSGWSGNLQEKTMPQAGPSQGLVALDPTEERILFSSDDGIWDAPFGRSNNMSTGVFGNPLEGPDYFSACPSIQSGSWSALMQSAVAEASSSDTGLQEEWSGVSFPKTELSTGNQLATFNDSGKGQSSWVDSNLQSASLISRPLPLFDANMSPSSRNVSGFQQSGVKFPYEQSEKVRPDSSHESVQESPKEGGKWLDCSPRQKPHVEGSHQLQSPMHLDNASDGAWAGQIYKQPQTAAHSTNVELNSQNFQGSWVHQQNMSSYNTGHPYNKPNGWNINEALSPGGNATLKAQENENTVQSSQSIDEKRAMQVEGDHNSGLWRADGNHVPRPFLNSASGLEHIKSGTGSPQVNPEDSQRNNFTVLPESSNTKSSQEINQQVAHGHPFDSSVKYKGNESGGRYQHQLGNIPHVFESSLNNSERSSGESHDKRQENSVQKEISSNSYNSSRVTGGGVRENSWLNANDPNPLAGANQKSLGQIGQKTPGHRKFQYHPMGSLGVNTEPAEAMKHVTHSQALSQQVTQGLKGQEKGYSKFVGHVLNNTMDIDKGQVADFQRSMKRSDETPSRGVIPGYGSNTSSASDGSAGFYPPNRTAQTSHNMLELLHKVDQSRDHGTAKQFDSSDGNRSFEMTDSEASETFVSHLRRTQSSASQGFGLRLAPPSQRLPVSSHAFPSESFSQAVNEHDSRHAGADVAEEGQTWLPSTAPVQSVSHSDEMSQREHWDNKSSISGQAGNENSLSNMQGKSAAFTSTLPYSRNQLQSHGGQVSNDPFDNLASRLTQTNNSHDRVASDQSAQASLPGGSCRAVPFNLGSPADTSHSVSTSSSYLRTSGQQLTALDSVPVSQPLVTSGISQQGAFSKMLHNVWNNVPSRQRLSASQPHKAPTSLFPFISPSNNNLETTSWEQKPSDQDIKNGVNSYVEFGAVSVNPQGFPNTEDQPRRESTWQQVPSEKAEWATQTAAASRSQDSVSKQLLDANSVASASLLAHRRQQEIDRRRNGKDPVVVSQTEHTSMQNPTSSNRDVEVFSRALAASNVHQNYSLLHQMQAMKGAETDPSKRILKRLKGPDVQQAAAMALAGQQLSYGYNAMVRDAVDNEMNSAARRSPFSSGDTKMLSFSSEVRDDANANVASQLIPSQDMVTSCRNDSQNHSSNINIPSTRAEHSKISLQMAPSWFEQYGTFKDVQMYDAQRTAKTAAQQFFFGKPSESLPTHTRTELVNAAHANQASSVWQSTTSTVVVSERSSPPRSFPPDVTDQSLAVVRPKKRKSAISVLLPWNKEVTQGSHRRHDISVAERDWAQAANRLIEKVEDDAEMIEDAQPLFRPRRRLILTTQLMQQLFRPAPASILSAEATSNYESVIYFVAKLALGDACSLFSSPGSGSGVPPDNANIASEKVKISETIGDLHFTKAVEGFIGRARKLENDLLRMDKRASILDLQVDCQDLERFSVINRFAKFHGRGHADGAETSSSSDAGATPQKAGPLRYVTALPLPKNLPEGVQCLSL